MEPELTEQQAWDRRWMNLTDHIATWSHDPSSKFGAVIIRPDNSIASYGVNNFPHGIADDERWHDRQVKYDLVVHSETNALIHAHECVRGYTLYTTTVPCIRCLVNILSAGIGRVVNWHPTADYMSRWGDSVRESMARMSEAVLPNDWIRRNDG